MLKPGHPNKMWIWKEKQGPVHWRMTGRSGTPGKQFKKHDIWALTAPTIEITIPLNVTPFNLVKWYWGFWGICCLHLQSGRGTLYCEDGGSTSNKTVIFTYLFHASEMARNMAVCTNGLVAPSNADVKFFFFCDNSLLFLETNTQCL